ncbi:uncharacterized protein TNCV_1173941 [Trichonephila clavipes]|nr:uncharacterized protein TNCV_1173941 [Trichonephila clavipes]
MEKNGHHYVIQYFYLKCINATNIKAELDSTLGEYSSSFTTVKYWIAEFKRGRTSSQDEHSSCRQNEVTTKEMAKKMHKVALDNRRLKLCELAGIARRRFVEWAQNEIAVVPDFHKRNLFSDEAHFWLNGYVNKQNCRTWSEAYSQVYVETPLHPEKLTVWCALWAGGIVLQKR